MINRLLAECKQRIPGSRWQRQSRAVDSRTRSEFVRQRFQLSEVNWVIVRMNSEYSARTSSFELDRGHVEIC
jgi:hypothetical protein